MIFYYYDSHNILFHSVIDWYMGIFTFIVISNTVAMNIFVHVCWHIYALVSLGYYLEVELLGQRICLSSILVDKPILFFWTVWEFPKLHIPLTLGITHCQFWQSGYQMSLNIFCYIYILHFEISAYNMPVQSFCPFFW